MKNVATVELTLKYELDIFSIFLKSNSTSSAQGNLFKQVTHILSLPHAAAYPAL